MNYKKETEKFQWSILGVALMLLNMLDCELTLRLLSFGGYETNPAMAALLAYSPKAFIFFKFAVVNLCFLFLGRIATDYKLARYALIGAAAIYLPVVLWSLYAFNYIALGTNV